MKLTFVGLNQNFNISKAKPKQKKGIKTLQKFVRQI